MRPAIRLLPRCLFCRRQLPRVVAQASPICQPRCTKPPLPGPDYEAAEFSERIQETLAGWGVGGVLS